MSPGGMPLMPTVPMAHEWAGSRLVCSSMRSSLVSSFGPSGLEVSQARGLPFDADAAMEHQRFGDGVVIGRRVGADLLELADVLRLTGRRGCSAQVFSMRSGRT